MKASLRILCIALATTIQALMGLPQPAAAGEVTTACFLPGAKGSCVRPVLQHVQFKSVITEFVDPQNTGIGHSLSRLMWRELLSSIGNVAGAGVILAHDKSDEMRRAFDGRTYQEYLETDYHLAATQIAKSLKVQMSLWGVVLEQDSGIFIQPFLTILPNQTDPWTRLRISNEGFELTVPLAHDRLNFAPVETDRSRLFTRRFATRCALSAGCPRGVPLRGGPSNQTPIVGYVPEGRSIQVRDMTEQWFRVQTQSGETAFLNIYHAEITSRTVHTRARRNVNIRPSPDGSRSLGKVDLSGSYDVIDVGTDGKKRIWYRIAAGGREGWVAGWLFKSNFTFPMIHFVEGLYRYARHDFNGSIAALQRFVVRGTRESNVTLAAAHQFLAAARLARSGQNPLGAQRAALHNLDAAATLTPFDPRAYALRSLANLVSARTTEKGILDLQRALELDFRSDAAKGLLRNLDQAVGRVGTKVLGAGRPPLPAVVNRFDSLRRRYR